MVQPLPLSFALICTPITCNRSTHISRLRALCFSIDVTQLDSGAFGVRFVATSVFFYLSNGIFIESEIQVIDFIIR